jgi:ABC-type polysaccharide/polyol phosphate export permease
LIRAVLVDSRVRHIVALIRLFSANERDHLPYNITISMFLPAILMYVMIMMGDGSDASNRRSIAAAITLGLGAAITRSGGSVLADRHSGRLDALRGLPISKSSYYLCRIGVGAGMAVVYVTGAILTVAASGLAEITGLTVGLAITLAAVGGTTFAGIGAAVAARANDLDWGGTMLTVGTIGFGVLSPVFYELERLPSWAQPIAWLSPYTHSAVQFRAMLSASDTPLLSVIATLILCVAYNYLGYRQLEWN